jgi:hypothetical protein
VGRVWSDWICTSTYLHKLVISGWRTGDGGLMGDRVVLRKRMFKIT